MGGVSESFVQDTFYFFRRCMLVSMSLLLVCGGMCGRVLYMSYLGLGLGSGGLYDLFNAVFFRIYLLGHIPSMFFSFSVQKWNHQCVSIHYTQLP